MFCSLSPEYLPHSFRFLPNSYRAMDAALAGDQFTDARDLYRLIFGLLVYYAIYRYARLFTNYANALFSMFIVATIYPVSFRALCRAVDDDPMSHLSFLLAFIFSGIRANSHFC